MILPYIKDGKEPWTEDFYAVMDEINAKSEEVEQARGGAQNLNARLSEMPTTTEMEQYVQSVAMTGVDPSDIGDPNNIVSINPAGDGFVGIAQETFLKTENYSVEIEDNIIARDLFLSMNFY